MVAIFSRVTFYISSTTVLHNNNSFYTWHSDIAQCYPWSDTVRYECRTDGEVLNGVSPESGTITCNEQEELLVYQADNILQPAECECLVVLLFEGIVNIFVFLMCGCVHALLVCTVM